MSAHVCTMTSSVKGMVSSPNPSSSLEKKIASLAASDSVRASTSHCGSGGVGVIPSGKQVSERSRGLLPHDGSLTFELSARSPKPPSCSDSAHALQSAMKIGDCNLITVCDDPLARIVTMPL